MKLKYLFTILLFMILSIGTNAQNKKTEKAVIKTTINCDHCKVCETCGLNFRDNMLKVKGVKMYELDEERETITVYFNPKRTDVKTIRTAISKMGFDADDIKADAEAYDKLDKCCKPTD